ncbi:MAG TPA: BON domain-containing protein [Armatimonadota bacterium]|nr:BON domain-containing protein [Armatimonadota bacterium]
MPQSQKLAHEVEEALAKDERTKGLEHVHVKAVGAALFLDGEVESRELSEIVEEVVKKVDGVGMVRNRLQVNPQERGGGWREPHRHEA